jgi:vacuolar-type H+-ATPase subunit I/STV1
MSTPLLVMLLLSFSTPAFAVYKCEAGGKTSYSDTPCAGGSVVATAKLTPAAIESARAEQKQAQQKEEARRLERERQGREAAEERQQRQDARARAARQKKCAALALRTKWAEEDAAKANPKAAPKAVHNARRAAEKHQLECGK